MDWMHVDERLPEIGVRILIYSPVYKEKESAFHRGMMFRIIDSQFLKISKEAKYWTYITPPEEENEDE